MSNSPLGGESSVLGLRVVTSDRRGFIIGGKTLPSSCSLYLQLYVQCKMKIQEYLHMYPDGDDASVRSTDLNVVELETEVRDYGSR